VAVRVATAENLDTVARYFQVLSDATRLQIIEELSVGERNVSDLVAAVGGGQSRVSNHLACLRWCGFVAARRAGREVFYSLADPAVEQVLQTVRQQTLGDRELRLDTCHAVRPARSRGC
jgi:ArsR family transcriptional regulator, cadmium/lead-responsive transcriptional repressor